MRRKLLATVLLVSAVGLFATMATTASATPTKTSRCTGCHTGPNVGVTATLVSTTATNATYNVSAPTATAFAVFDGTTKVGSTVIGTSGAIVVPFGKTYTIYAIKGPLETDGIGSTSVSPIAPVVTDTTAPTTTSNAVSTYVSSAVITLTAVDNVGGSGVATTYYALDGAAPVVGTTVSTSVLGSHTLSFWSVDVAGNIELANLVSFEVTAPPVPVPDTTAPVTTSNVKATYAGSASITLTAVDNVGGSGVAHTYYILDGAPQAEGLNVSTSVLGSHTLSFWSVDVAGNIELATAVTFEVTVPAPEATSTVTIKASLRNVHSGHAVRLSGVLTPAKHGAKLALYVQKPGSTRWVLIGRPTVNSKGAWNYNVTANHHGTYTFQVRYTSGGTTIVSDTVTVTVASPAHSHSHARD